ncbi:jg27126 [Pararge aegeria aegeria]|uniref:Jg27126 protein n=1 Tax=Pararge aegeria aegeria TaxID=348720 RepID=A0A8S4QW68_9NEOP|nr:jg27126 [Pararge aegeria aegeria]
MGATINMSDLITVRRRVDDIKEVAEALEVSGRDDIMSGSVRCSMVRLDTWIEIVIMISLDHDQIFPQLNYQQAIDVDWVIGTPTIYNDHNTIPLITISTPFFSFAISLVSESVTNTSS